MNSPLDTTDVYVSVLREYLVGGDAESALLRAYELGRESVGTGFGLLDMVSVHRESLALALSQAPTTEVAARMARSAFGLFLESLAPFEMAYRGFREANATLQQLNATLEQQVSERTRELREIVVRLREADEERRELLGRLVTAQEDERRRIASDIHDDSIQHMAAVAMRIDMLLRRHPELEASEGVSKLSEAVQGCIGSLRRLVFDLRPQALDAEGLAAALREYLEHSFEDEGEGDEEEAGPECRLEDRLRTEPPEGTRAIIYRIAQEALANARKHARASRIDVLLAEDGDGYLVRISDDGVGFSTESSPRHRPGHLGLADMRERAEVAGGWWRVESAIGEGTTVEFFLPSQAENSAT